jgi:hypothetical protein
MSAEARTRIVRPCWRWKNVTRGGVGGAGTARSQGESLVFVTFSPLRNVKSTRKVHLPLAGQVGGVVSQDLPSGPIAGG